MKLVDIGPLQSDHLIKALCNTLLHSLWQGVILAVIAGLIIVFTKKASAAVRYNLLTAALVLFAVGTIITFITQMQTSAASSSSFHFEAYNGGAPSPIVLNTTAIQAPAVATPPPVSASFTQQVTAYFNTHYNLIVLVWFLIICAKSIQMGVGVYGIYHLKRSKLSSAGEFWTARVAKLTGALRIKQAVQLMESGLAKVPMVVGHLKPVILVPVGLVYALSTEEVEAILLHELAHICRRDYLVNFLQSFMEIIFFFNPAVLWLSQLIRAERENCCDDIAVAQTGSRFNYMNALVNCHEYQGQAPAYGLAFAGNKGSLLSRIKRMVNNRNQSLNMFEKTVLTISLVALGLGVSAFAEHKNIEKAVKAVASVIHSHSKALKQEIQLPANATSRKKQPVAPVALIAPRASVVLIASAAPVIMPQDTISPEIKALAKQLDSIGRHQNPVAPLRSAMLKTDTGKTFRVFHQIVDQLYREGLIVNQNNVSISLNDHEMIVNGVKMPEGVYHRYFKQFGSMGSSGNYNGSYTNSYYPSGDRTHSYYPSDSPDGQSVIVPDFGDTLVKYGVIKNKRFTHVTFNSGGLIINGVKQPDDVCQMLLKKYGDNVNITYTNNGLSDKRMEQNAYWAGQERKIIDQMQREGLINDRENVTFTLNNKTFLINGQVQNGEVFERYRREYVPADAADNWIWNHYGPSRNYLTDANRYNNSGAYYQQSARERQQAEAERDKKLVADLLQDGLITDSNNVTFTLNQKDLTVNGKKQSDELYQKYKTKYVPNDSGGTWSWTYSHHK